MSLFDPARTPGWIIISHRGAMPQGAKNKTKITTLKKTSNRLCDIMGVIRSTFSR
jgi:hypothetical protein